MASNSGAPWTAELNSKLLQRNKEGRSLASVAEEFGRSEMSIRCQTDNLFNETYGHNKFYPLDDDEIKTFREDVSYGKTLRQLALSYELPVFEVKKYIQEYKEFMTSAYGGKPSAPVKVSDHGVETERFILDSYLTIVNTRESNQYIHAVIDERKRRGVQDIYGFALNPLINAFKAASIKTDVRGILASIRRDIWDKVIYDIFCDQINEVQPIEPPKETEEPKMKLFKIETVVEIDGVNVANLSDDKIIEFISQIEDQINKLSLIETHSLAIEDKIEQLNDNAFQLAKILDSRIK